MRERTGKLVDKSILVSGTIALLLNQNKTPVSWSTFVSEHSWVLILIVAVAGFFGAATPMEAIANRARADQRPKLQRQLLIGLGDFIRMADASVPDIHPLEDVGLHTWVIKRTLKNPIDGVLRRTGTYRLGGGRQTVGSFSPKKGVGVVGLCWKHNIDQAYNVESIAADLTDEAQFERQRQMDGDSVMNFSWQQFRQVSHRGAVFAAPVRTGGRFVGCISVDCSRGFNGLVERGIVHRLNTLTQSFDGRDLSIL